MMKAHQGRCHTCGRDADSEFAEVLMPVDASCFLKDGERYLIRVDTGHPMAGYRFVWDVGHWIAGAFNHHVMGKITHFRVMPLPNAVDVKP